ncbi:MAG: SIR2 family protein [Alphaproteobacteria bacterium]|nr:SIR2 family protein [Alphaproteobacteria bacterium]
MDDQQRTELKFFSQQEYDVVLGMLERRMDGVPGSGSTMRVAARKVISRTASPNAIHSSLVRLSQRFGRTLLATTNFDRLLSVSAKALKLGADAYSLGNIPSPSRSAEFSGIMHIHGMIGIGRLPSSTLILTDQDFGDFYLRRHIITSFLYDAARIFRIVLVGYSANDSPVRYLLNAIAGDERHFDDLKTRYSFVGHRPTDSRTPVEWSSRGISPVSYDTTSGHGILSDVLSRWAELIPEKQNEKIISAAIEDIAAQDPDVPSAGDALGLFKYFVRRSTSVELVGMARQLNTLRASGKWINVLSAVSREPR